MGQYRGPKTLKSFARYAVALHRDRQEVTAYRIYVAESLRLIPQGKYLTEPFGDILKPRPTITKDGDSIVRDVVERAGLVVT